MSGRSGRAAIAALSAALVAIGATSLARPGYTPDEEYTLFAVRGITAHGIPLLPSGLLYDRGLLYSYLSWIASVSSGAELPAFRALALLTAAGTLICSSLLIGRTISRPAAISATGLIAVALPFWAVATTGRFYAQFLLTAVGLLLALALGRVAAVDARHGWRNWIAIAILAAASRLTHELAFTLVAVPFVGAVMTSPGRDPRNQAFRSLRRWMRSGAAIVVGLVAAQATLMALHFVQPPLEGGGAMIQRFFLWQVLNLFERPTGAPLGVVAAALVVACLVVPARAVRSAILALGAAVLIAIAAVFAFAGSGTSPFAGSLVYPLDMFWYLAQHHPLLVGATLLLLIARLAGAGGEWPPAERAAHLAWIGWVLWFGIIESGITINYVLLPAVCALAAIGIDLVAIGQHTGAIWPGRRAQVLRAALAGVALLVAADQWRGTGSLADRLAVARPTIAVDGIEALRAAFGPEDRIACTDELACLLLVGRVDAWLALDDYVRERFIVSRQDGAAVGVYAGTPVIERPRELLAAAPGSAPSRRAIVVDVFKEYPVGNSRAWLPRALSEDGLESVTLLTSPYARVVELHPGPNLIAAASASPAARPQPAR